MERTWIMIGIIFVLVLTEKFETTLAGTRRQFRNHGCYGDVTQIDCREKIIKIMTVSVYKTAKCSPLKAQETMEVPELTSHIRATCQSKSNCFVRLVVPATAYLYDMPEDTRCVCMDIIYMCIGGGRVTKPTRKKPDEEIKRSNEYLIKKKLLSDYDKTSRPVKNDNSTVTVNIAMSLFHILDTNEKHQTFSSLVSIRIRWRDEYMTWDPTKYGNVSMVHIPAYTLWLPDLVISNHADDAFKGFPNTYVIVRSSGALLWMIPAMIKSTCTLDVRHFPFDSQHCDIHFISWTYNGFELNILYNASVDANAIAYSGENQEWWVNDITENRMEKVYACCPEPYPRVSFTVHMARRGLFYIFNLIFPSMLIFLVCMLGFFLPIESGEKVNLEIVVLLTQVVFLMIIGEKLPPTPEGIPLIGMLFGSTMLLASLALVMAVIVTSVHLRKYTKTIVPTFVAERIICCPCSKEAKKGPIQTLTRRLSRQTSRELETDVDTGVSMESTNRPRVNGITRNGGGENHSHAAGEQLATELKPAQPCICKSPECWAELATVLDKIFFYTFLLCSMVMFYFIMSQIPSHSVRSALDPHPT